MWKKMGQKRVKQIAWLAAVGLICVGFLLWMFYAYQNKLGHTIEDTTNVYLQEMNSLNTSYFLTGMENEFSKSTEAIDGISTGFFQDYDSFNAFLQKQQDKQQFDVLGFLNDRGELYTAEGLKQTDDAYRQSFQSDQSYFIGVGSNLQEEPALFLTRKISNVSFLDQNFVAVVIGMDMQRFSEILALNRHETNAFSYVVTSTGDYALLPGNREDARYGDNLFQRMDEQATFDHGYSAQQAKDKMAAGSSGMTAYSRNGVHQYLYYAPIPQGHGLYLCTNIAYGTIDKKISDLSRFMVFTAACVIGMVIAAAIVLFVLYNRDAKRNAKLLAAEKEKAENALKMAEHANQSKNNFLSRISHEVRTPMNGVIGMTIIAMENVDDKGKVVDCLKKISLSSKHLLSLINDILDMSLMESGNIELHKEKFDFRLFMESLSIVFYDQAKAKGIDFDVTLTDQLPEQLIGDSLRLNQIIYNLLSNAMKFTPRDGKVSVKLEKMRQLENQVWLRFSVEDTGCGIAKEDFETIFESFGKSEEEQDQRSVGSGLGLSITKKFVQLMGGKIWLESQKGVGSIFYVELPFTIAVQPGELRESFGAFKLLVVEDDRATRDYMAALLKKLGARVDVVANGVKGASLVEKAHEDGAEYDICFVDWDMPVLSGVDTVKRMSQVTGNPKSPVILLTAYNPAAIDQEAEKAGAAGVLHKPVFLSSLVNTLLDIQADRSHYGEKPIDPERHNFEGKHILVAEDNELNMEIAIELLKMTGAKVDTAVNGKQAVDKFAQSSRDLYDLILMDVRMPMMDGYEATKTIREMKRPDAKTIPIFAMTANALSEDRKKSMEAGMNAHINKPVSLQELYETMEEYLHNRAEKSEE